MDPQIERVTDPSYLEGLAGRDLEEVRRMRSECREIENSLSFARRVVQGRLDILVAEAQRRRNGGAPGDLSDLIERLPGILADRVGSSGSPRPPQDVAAITDDYLAEADALLSPAAAVAPTDLDDDQLDAARRGLEALERTLSTHRQGLHVVIDGLQAEITRRYRTGEASVDSLLQ